MTQSREDIRLVELELEDLYGQLARVRRRSGEDFDGGPREQTRELLRISREIRDVAERVRYFSERARRNNEEKLSVGRDFDQERQRFDQKHQWRFGLAVSNLE